MSKPTHRGDPARHGRPLLGDASTVKHFFLPTGQTWLAECGRYI